MSEESIERVRRMALALPEATEQEAWGEPTFRVKKKIFAMCANASNHHGAGKNAVWCPAPLGVQQMLVRDEPEKFYAPPYVGPKGWIGVYVDAVDDKELHGLLVQAYCMIAPKKLQALVG